MLHSIRMVNYRQYSDKTVHFNEKLNVIQGRNGTGKSTIVEAIGYALQGSPMQKGQAKDWIKDGQSVGLVELRIDDYVVTRGNKIQTVTDSNGVVLATGQTGVTSWIESTYGLTLDAYKTSYHIAQKEISNFASLSSMERTKRVEKLLRIDVIDEIKQVAQGHLRTRKVQFADIDTKLKGLEQLDKEALEANRLKVPEIEKEIDILRQEAENQAVAKSVYQEQLRRWQSKQVLLTRTEGYTVKLIDSLIDTYKASMKKQSELKVFTTKKARLDTLGKKLRAINVHEKYFNDDLEALMNLKHAQSVSLKAKKDLENISIDNLTKPEQTVEELKEVIAQVKGQLRGLNTQSGMCPTCGQKMPDNSKLIKKLEASLANYRGLYDLAVIFEQYNDLKAKTIENDNIELTQEAIDSLVNKADYLEAQKLASELESYGELIVDDSNYEEMIASLTGKLKDLAKLEDYEDVVEPKEFIEQPFDRLLKDRTEELNQINTFIKKQEQVETLFESYTADRAILEVKVKQLSDFILFISSYRKAFSAKVLPLVEDNAGKIVSYLSEGKIANFSLNEDYSVNGYEKLSGSEEDSADFALRLAIAQISRLGSYNTMVLDEVAASFDNVKENKLLDILKATNMQLIYISHGELVV